MRNIVKMLMDLGFSVYLEEFEKPFLEVSAEFYKGESQKIMECCDCGDYLKRAEIRINEERDDCYPHDKISPQGELRLEISLMVKLKTECGYQFISKLEGMFTDMKTSQDTMQGFYASHPELADGPILVVQVLTTGLSNMETEQVTGIPASDMIAFNR
ncbi:hypothetical protein V6N12_041428 [Hibiscus sabdariffa]|uniref:Cullin family profile domain-containing protein n=1 Tax=Hibiscus sabdariffa TaxID=183260 RepID=A0ABR2E6L1_9ROSI